MTPAPTLRPASRATLRRQRGATLFGLVFWAIVVAFVFLMGIRIWPSLNEYITINQAVERVMHAEPVPTDILAVRRAFDRQKDIEYSIQTISGADLEIEPRDDRSLRVRFAYDKEIEIFGPVFLLIKYRGGTR
jgi:Domain of unknown function (DUF4845)